VRGIDAAWPAAFRRNARLGTALDDARSVEASDKKRYAAGSLEAEIKARYAKAARRADIEAGKAPIRTRHWVARQRGPHLERLPPHNPEQIQKLPDSFRVCHDDRWTQDVMEKGEIDPDSGRPCRIP
jgi:hypothetical protein